MRVFVAIVCLFGFAAAQQQAAAPQNPLGAVGNPLGTGSNPFAGFFGQPGQGGATDFIQQLANPFNQFLNRGLDIIPRLNTNGDVGLFAKLSGALSNIGNPSATGNTNPSNPALQSNNAIPAKNTP